MTPGRHQRATPGSGRFPTRAALALTVVVLLLIGLAVQCTRPDGDRAAEGPSRQAPADPDALPSNAASGDPPTGPCAPDDILVPACGAWWGAYVPQGDGSLFDAVTGFEERIGRKLDILYTYHDMSGGPTDGQLLTPDEQELGRDRLLMLAWESTVWTEPHHENWTETQLGWKNVADGSLDEKIIDPQARRIKAYGKRVFFSFDQELDARTPDAGTPEEYVAAYRHLHDRFEELGVTNVVWVWTISGYLGSTGLFERMYPGDDYVDWIGTDQYNYYLCHRTENWKDFRQSQRPTYDWVRKNISATKPVMLAEYGTAPDPDDPERQREWFTDIPGAVREMPGVRALVQWNAPVPGPGCDLTVDSGPSLEGFRAAGRDDYFHQPLPGR